MDSHISCLRCGKRIAVKPEMVGQTILCPNCLDRVYVSESSNQGKPTPATSSAADPLAEAQRVLDAAAVLKRNQTIQPERNNTLLMVAVAVVGLIVIGGALAFAMRPAKKSPAVAVNSTNLPPAPPLKRQEDPDTDRPDRDIEEEDEDDAAARRRKAAKAAQAAPGTSAAAAVDSKTADQSAASATPKVPLPQPIMAGWPEVWRLPPASASDAAEVLTPLAESKQPPRIGLRSADGDLRTAPIVIEQEGRGDTATWVIKRVTNPLSLDGRIPLATLRRDGGNLLMAWAAAENELPEGPALVNCLIDIMDGNQRRTGQLREPVRAEPIVLNLELEKQVIETKLDAPPRPMGMRLEVLEMSGLPGGAKLKLGPKASAPFAAGSVASLAPTPQPTVGLPRPGMNIAPPGLIIDFAEIPGLEIRLRGAAETTGKLAVLVDVIYRDGLEHDLRVPKVLDRLEAEARKPLPAAERELGPEERKLESWQAKAKDQKGKEPPQNDFKRHSAWQNTHRQTLAKVAEFESNVNRFKRTIEACETRLSTVAKIREFMKQIGENQAMIHYIVCTECGAGDPDLLLVDGRGKR